MRSVIDFCHVLVVPSSCVFGPNHLCHPLPLPLHRLRPSNEATTRPKQQSDQAENGLALATHASATKDGTCLLK